MFERIYQKKLLQLLEIVGLFNKIPMYLSTFTYSGFANGNTKANMEEKRHNLMGPKY